MDSSGFFAVEWMLKAGAATFAVLAALFAFCDVLRGDRQDAVREWFGARWSALSQSPWSDMPQNSVVRRYSSAPMTGSKERVPYFRT